MSKKDFQNWSHERLLHEYKELLNRKKFGLVWEDKKEDVAEKCKDFLPVLKEEKNREVSTNKNDVNHIFIEGDNYHALSVLNYTHKKKIDIIYIDPPYNTGNKDFVFNDDYVDKENRFRHSKWLSFMRKRLRLAKNLLKNSGIIIISIDDNELVQLKMLLDDPKENLFGENNFIALLPTIMNLKGNNDQFGFSGTHEYTLVYAKDKSKAKINEFDVSEEEILNEWEQDDIGYFKKGSGLFATSFGKYREDRPYMYFPVLVKNNEIFLIKKEEYKKIYNKETKKFSDKYVEKVVKKYEKLGYEVILPIDTEGNKLRWTWAYYGKFQKNINEIIISRSKNNRITLNKKQRPNIGDLPTKKPKTLFYKPEYSSSNGTAQLKEMFGKKVFDNPKPLELIKDFLRLTTDKNSIILDFMAGSGTTGHAVLSLNKEDEGKRQFILCTNNELNGIGSKLAKKESQKNKESFGICNRVIYPRLKKAMEGYAITKGKHIIGLGGNLKYFKTSFIANVKTDNDKRIFTNQSTEMLCLAEKTFDKIINKKGQFALYQNKEQITGIIYDEDYITDFKKEIEKFKKSIVVYVFSYDHTYSEEDFADIKNLVKVNPIPEVILNVYRKIYKDLYKTKRI